MYPNEILFETKIISDNIKKMLSAKSIDEIKDYVGVINGKIQKLKKEPRLEEYCINVKNLIDIFLSAPFTPKMQEGSLLNLLSINSNLRMKIIDEFSLCSEPNY